MNREDSVKNYTIKKKNILKEEVNDNKPHKIQFEMPKKKSTRQYLEDLDDF